MTPPPLDVRPDDPAFYVEPWSVYSQMRQQAPVYWYEPLRMWVLTRLDDLKAVAMRADIFTSAKGALLNDAIYAPAADSDQPTGSGGQIIDAFFDENAMISTADGPPHVAMRKAMAAAFSPRLIARREKLLRGYVNELLDSLPVHEEFDFYEAVASKLPIWTVLLQVGFADLSLEELRGWTDTVEALGQPLPAEELARAAEVIRSVVEYVGAQMDSRPPDAVRDDDMVAALERQRDIISGVTARNLVTAVLLAGATSSRALLCSVMYALATNPDQLAAALADPGLAGSVVEETLRWATPVMSFMRTATQDTMIGEQKIRSGDRVLLLFHAVNHDPEHFPDPERFDITRSGVREHVAFGYGPHTCPGKELARLEMTVFVEEFLRRFATIEVTRPPERAHSILANAFTGLMLKIG